MTHVAHEAETATSGRTSPVDGTAPDHTEPSTAEREGAGPLSPGEPPPSSGPLHVIKVFGSIITPLSLITALMYYFGVLHAFWFFGSFGVDYSVFGLTHQDYLFRSADGLFVPLTVAAVASLIVLWGHRLLPTRLTVGRRRAAARAAAPTAAVGGVVLLGIAAVGVLDPGLLQGYLTLPGLSLVFGVLLLLAASRTTRWLRMQGSGASPPSPTPLAVAATEWSAVLVLVSVGLFWAAGDWSAAVGTRRGSQVLDSLPAWPDAVLYSERSLNLAVPGVRETACSRPEAAYGFRYDGLKMIVQAGGQYLFLPEGWSPADGTAIVMPKTDTLRLEFTAAGVARTGTC